MLASWKKSYHKPGQCIKKQRHHFVNKVMYSQSYGFSSSHVWMWVIDHKEGWALGFFQTVVLKTLESPLESKIKPVNPKGNQLWIFTGGTDAEAPILWLPDAKSWLTGKPWCWERLKAAGGNSPFIPLMVQNYCFTCDTVLLTILKQSLSLETFTGIFTILMKNYLGFTSK